MSTGGSVTRSWVLGLVLAGAAVGAVALSGGFAPAGRAPGIEVAPGEMIHLTRWDLSVDSCVFEPSQGGLEDAFGRVVISLTATNTWKETQAYLNDSSYAVDLPNGDRLGASTGNYVNFADAETSGGFDPGFTRPAIITAELVSPYWESDEPVRLRFANETQSDGFLTAGDWVADRQVATVTVPCPALDVA